MNFQYELVDDEAGFQRAIEAIDGQPRIGFDLESNSFFRYPERICLLQLSTPTGAFLIDPLAVASVKPLGEILADASVETILHGGGSDIRCLDRDWGYRIGRVFDTGIAAAFVGIRRLGLASVLASVLDVIVPKQKKLQRSDWTRRPLSRESLNYAAEDVRYLLDLRDTLWKKLHELGREGWVAEECERLAAIRYEPPDPELAVFNVKGWRDLDGRGLAILKALLDYRERHALRMGRPHFRVIPDTALVALAAKPDAVLREVRGLGRFAHGKLAAGLREAVARGRSAKPPRRSPRPGNKPLMHPEGTGISRRLAKLKSWRMTQGDRLSLDPALLWPMKSLQGIAREPETLTAALHSPDVRSWQRSEFADSLSKALD